MIGSSPFRIFILLALMIADQCRGDEAPPLDVPITTFEGMSNLLPIYPVESLKLKESGKVTVKVEVDSAGGVKNAYVVSSSNHPRLDQSALDTIKTWHFKPKQIAGLAQEDWAWVPIAFSESKVSVERLLTSDPRRWAKDQRGCRLFDYSLHEGAKYDWSGGCLGGYIHGEGRLTVIKNDSEIYRVIGIYQHGLIEGQATRVVANQSEYQGHFLRGLKHGKGLQVWKHDMRYEGEYVDNCMEGQGEMSWSNGVRFAGIFVNGKAIGQDLQPPKLKTRVSLHYPEEFEGRYIQGEVNLRVMMSDLGQLQEIEVLDSDHPALEKEALRTLVSAKFIPATMNGKSIPVIFRQPVSFGSKGVGFKPYEVKLDDSGESSDLNQQMHKPDRLPSFKVIAPLVYPFELMRKNVTGEAQAVVVIDPTGKPREIRVTSASQPEFADAIHAMLASSEFNPATRDGVAIWSNLTLTRTFSRGSGDVFFDKHVLRLLGKIKDNQRDIFKLTDLDKKPNAIFHPTSTQPNDMTLKQDEKVMLTFYIDKTGRAQLPQVIKTNHPELGWLAMTAVSRWQFEPPTVKGEPVDVTVNLPVLFSAPAPSPL